MSAPLVLYDGQCGVCNRFVQWVLDRDPRGRISFAPLQGQTAKTLLKGPPDLSTVIVVDEKKLYYRSDAVLRVVQLLGGPSWLYWVLRLSPRPLRELGYWLFARVRHVGPWKNTQCRLLNAEERKRFYP